MAMPPEGTAGTERLHWRALLMFGIGAAIGLAVGTTILAVTHLLLPTLSPWIAIVGIAFTVIMAIAGTIIKGVDVLHVKDFGRPQAWVAIGVGLAVSTSLLVLMTPLPWPHTAPAPPVRSTNPYPPYRGALVLDGMPTASGSSAPLTWDNDATGGCRSDGAAYHVVATHQERINACFAHDSDFHNLAFEVHVTFKEPGEAGIDFRFTQANGHDTFYDLALESYGYIYLYVYTPSGSPGKLIDRGVPPDHFDREIGDANRLAVVMDGPVISIYVNGVFVAQATDDTSTHGSLAVHAAVPGGSSQQQTEVMFSDAKGWTW